MLNEDCNHFIHTRHVAGIQVGINELCSFIDQYANTDVKDLLFNVNAMLAFFPSKSRENAIDKYLRLLKAGKDMDISGTAVKTAYDIFVKQNLDMYKIWIERSRYNGISPWISIRMNDIHNNQDEGHFLLSSFFEENKHMRRVTHRPNSNYFDNALDYTFPEVQEHYLSLIKEVVERYDFDGLELDWMREVYLFKIGGESEWLKILTNFMRIVRKILDQAEKERGHKIKICVRVPYSPEVALRFGLDVLTWARNGLVDVIVPTARWATTDNNMPIDFWKQILDGTGAIVAAGIEILLEATRANPKYNAFNSLETARGSAYTYLNMGADKIYLFNYMDQPSLLSHSLEFNSAVDKRNYHELLITICDLETASKLPRRNVVTYHDIAAPGLRNGDLLPLCCSSPNSNGSMIFKNIRIETGPINKNLKRSLVLGIDSKRELDSSDFDVYWNTNKCKLVGIITLSAPKPNCKTYKFKIECSEKSQEAFPSASIIEIASKNIPFSVEWAEILINYQGC